MKFDRLVFAIVLVALGAIEGRESDGRSRRKRYLLEPSGTQMGIFGTIAVPLEKYSQVSVAYFIEENWYVVQNASWFRGDFEGPEIDSARSERSADSSGLPDSISRRFAYVILENHIERHSLPGRACLLRAICEHASAPFHLNGVLGDILYVVFTPSSSRDEHLPEVFYEAEKMGRSGRCINYERKCPSSLIDSFSQLEEYAP